MVYFKKLYTSFLNPAQHCHLYIFCLKLHQITNHVSKYNHPSNKSHSISTYIVCCLKLMDLPVKRSWLIKENLTYVLVESNLVGKFGNLCQHGFVLPLHPLKIHFRDLCFLLKICYVPKYVHLSPHFDLKQFNNLKKVLSVQHVMDKLGRLSYTTVTAILLCRISF